jgi:hypothetical protein
MTTTREGSDLLNDAKEDGVLSDQSLQTLTALDIGAQIGAALGTPALDVESSEVTLFTILIDDSASINMANNEQVVRDGYNLVLDALTDTSRLSPAQIDSILIHACYLNAGDLHEYRPVSNAVGLDSHNYHGSGGTPLYDQAAIVLAKVLAKAQEFTNEGVAVRTVTLIVTDGHDEHSRRATARDVAQIMKDVLEAETNIVAAMGIDDGGYTDFRQVFSEMGVRDEWILTPGNTPAEIRAAFQMFSQSAQQASQAAAFSSMGGFKV